MRLTWRLVAESRSLAATWIDTPASDLGPAELAAGIESVAHRLGARFRAWVGEELLGAGFPCVYAVGRAASGAPRVVEALNTADSGPKITLVGKGVCFDTGGLDLKPSAMMGLMKKDMAGAACALALAQMLIEAQVPIRLRLLVPVVENSVSASSYRPGDVLTTRGA